MPYSSPIVYSIANDTLNGIASMKALQNAIEADAGITSALDCACNVGDVLHIDFETEISDSEKAALDAVVAAHDGVRLNDGVYVEDGALKFRGGNGTITTLAPA